MDIKIKIECPDLARAAEMIANALAYRRSGESLLVEETGHTAANYPGKLETATAAPEPEPVTPAPVVAPEPVAAPAPVAPVAAAPQITIDQIGKAGADLLSKNPAAMPQLMALLQKYGVQSAQQLKPEQIGAFATEMRALGAVI